MTIENIMVFTTGGTLDKVYHKNGTLVVGDSVVEEMLMKLHRPAMVKKIFQKDSQDLDETDRQIIVHAVQQTSIKKILITHGTDTINQTAQELESNLNNNEKTIVLTGAWVPNSILGSEASLQVGYALAALDLLPPGVYVSMDGQVGKANALVKNKELSCFEVKT